MAEHAKYSPSKLSRILSCPGSVDFIEHLKKKKIIPEEEDNEYSLEGTMLHRQQDLAVQGQPFTEQLDEEQKAIIEENRDWLAILCHEFRSTAIVTEVQVSLERYNIRDCFGTADIIFSGPTSLHVLDWKFGRGVPVSAKKNKQLMTYLLGAIASDLGQYDRDMFIHIAQPRLSSFQTYEVKKRDLFDLIKQIKIAQRSHDITPGQEQCLWCEAKLNCAEYDTWVGTKAIEVFSVLGSDNRLKANELQTEKAVKILLLEPVFQKAFKAIRSRLNQLSDPELEACNMKRVAGRSYRRFVSDEDITQFILERYPDQADDMFVEAKLKSPAQMEKTFKGIKRDPEFQKRIFKPLGKPTIVSIHDKRPAYTNNAESTFKHLAKKA